jgi:spore maturation protein CgeB
MRVVFFGLSITSAWGNGHATLLRGLFRALRAGGHEVHFFEKDVPYYAAHRDTTSFPYVNVRLYSNWASIAAEAETLLVSADVGIVTSYCADALNACELVLSSRLWRKVFYDMDTPVTLSRLEDGEAVPYIPEYGLGDFDLVLSYTGGRALAPLKSKLHAARVATLYGWVDPETHYRVPSDPKFASDLSYLGTYAADRHKALHELLIGPAKELHDCRFLVGGAMYPDANEWPKNVKFLDHVSPPEHSQFYSSSLLTLNITRQSMARMGYCPSGRLFEAAACGTAVLSDWWEGLDTFFEPGREILIAPSTQEAVRWISFDREEILRIGQRAMEKALACHTAEIRAQRLIDILQVLPDESAPEANPTMLVSEAT